MHVWRVPLPPQATARIGATTCTIECAFDRVVSILERTGGIARGGLRTRVAICGIGMPIRLRRESLNVEWGRFNQRDSPSPPFQFLRYSPQPKQNPMLMPSTDR